MDRHDLYMNRCLELAERGAGSTAPNPMVGAVLVHNGRIIGEGCHEVYGGPHAEVNCINSVKADDRQLMRDSTLYVSLEPCAHFGKTPPCADLVISQGIPRVVIGSEDPFPEVHGKGIRKLRDAGVEVEVLSNASAIRSRWVNRRFFTNHLQQRPYVILKWAETADGKIGSRDSRVMISNEFTNRLVHKWRSEEAAILVGANTAASDDPRLDNRYWTGRSPVRVVLDQGLRLASSLQLMSDGKPTIVLNSGREQTVGSVQYKQISREGGALAVLNVLHQYKLSSVLVEGGTKTLQLFIDAGLWDEARIIRNTSLILGHGINAPSITNAAVFDVLQSQHDTITFLKRITPGG